LNLPLSDELQNAFCKARGQSSIRYLKIQIKNEKLVLESTGTSSSFSLDFNSFQKSLTPNELCYIAFRYKDAFANAPWALIMYTPDSCPVKDKMLYASSFDATRDALGYKYFSKIKRYESPSDFIWNNFQNAESDEINEPGDKPKMVDPNKPWNKRELAIQQLEKEEAQAIRDFEQMALEKPKAASGFSQVSFPLTAAAEEAIRGINSGSYNWIQFTLNSPPTHIDVITTKTVTSSELPEAVDPVEPKFYLFNKETTIVLIYCCPDKVSGTGFSETLKNRMIYSTCKATFAESIRALGISNLKKYDVREPSELTDAAITVHLGNKVSALFTGAQLKGSPIVPTGGFRGNSPANRPRYNQSYDQDPVSASKGRQPKQGSLAGLMASTGTGKSNKPLPKGVVIPPSGAYC